MEAAETTTQLVETRRAEAMALFTTAQDYNAHNDRLVTLGTTFITAAAALALKEGFADEVQLIAPAALLVVFIYASQIDTDVRVMGIARERIEKVLAYDLGADGLIYYSAVGHLRRGEYIAAAWILLMVVLMATGFATVLGAVVAFDRYKGFGLFVFSAVITILWGCLIRSFYEKQCLVTPKAKEAVTNWGFAAPD